MFISLVIPAQVICSGLVLSIALANAVAVSDQFTGRNAVCCGFEHFRSWTWNVTA